MAEKAFHRFNLIQKSDGKIGHKHIKYNAFSINLKVNKGIDLTKFPFLAHKERISSSVSYQVSQALGEDMRNQGVEAFISYSARCLEHGKNVNILSPSAFGENKDIEKTFQSISCYYTKDSIEFSSRLHEKPFTFNLQDFFVQSEFPMIS